MLMAARAVAEFACARARTAWMEVSKGRDPPLNLPLCFNLKRGLGLPGGGLDSGSKDAALANSAQLGPSREAGAGGLAFRAWGDVRVLPHALMGCLANPGTPPKGFCIGAD